MTANLQLVKETNLTLIFNLIYTHRPISRAELAKITRLSPTTVSSLVDELQRRGMVFETGAAETGTSGRKPILLDIDARGGFIISIEMVAGGFYCLLYDLVCMQVDAHKYSVSDFGGVGEKLIEGIQEILKTNGIPENKLKGIAIGVPGLVDYSRGKVISSTVVPIDENNSFYQQVKERFADTPMILENESCFCAYAEKEFGQENNAQNLVFIDINVGIGAGILIDGKVYRGSCGLAGEIGHISIDINGPKCKCGNRGCLEVMAGIPSMIQSLILSIMSGRETVVKEMIKNDFNRIDTELIRNAAAQQDEIALEVVDVTAMRLAFGINNVINLFNPGTVILGGEIMKLGTLFLDRVREHLAAIELKPNIAGVEVKYSAIQGNSSTLGGARYVLDHIFQAPGLVVKEM